MKAYYNENDPKAAAWLRSLIAAELIPDGEVDERSIAEIKPGEIAGYDQVHLFAGIAGWSLALELAGWPIERTVWTGSCPCQPFSAAGKHGGKNDPRHLWPEMRRLIAECQPPICFGEQVASKSGREWLNGIRLDLEALGYAVGAADLCAAGVGAPHIRQRLWWVADSEISRSGQTGQKKPKHNGRKCEPGRTSVRLAGGMANSDGRDTSQERKQRSGEHGQQSENGGPCGDTGGEGLQERVGNGRIESGPISSPPWEAFELASCRDGKARRIEPGTFPLAHGVPGRVAQLRGLGNAICPQVAAEFIAAYLEAIGD